MNNYAFFIFSKVVAIFFQILKEKCELFWGQL